MSAGDVSSLLRKLGLRLARAGGRLLVENPPREIWIDVGAHLGELTFIHASANPSLIVYAFEPNLGVALQRVGLLSNYIVIPMAVLEQEGYSDFYENAYDASSSVLPLDPEGVMQWIGGDSLRVVSKRTVPAIRLDTFMKLARIEEVDFLKVDAQGADLSVIKSCGSRLRDIRRITLEVSLTPTPLYVGAAGKEEIVEYMAHRGFPLVGSEKQTGGQEENLTFLRK